MQCWTRNCSCLCQVFVTYFSSDQLTRYLSPTSAHITHLSPHHLLEPRSPGKVFVTYLSQHHPLEPRSPDKVYSPVLTHSSSRCVTSLSHSNSLACHLSVKGGRRICFDGYHFFGYIFMKLLSSEGRAQNMASPSPGLSWLLLVWPSSCSKPQPGWFPNFFCGRQLCQQIKKIYH